MVRTTIVATHDPPHQVQPDSVLPSTVVSAEATQPPVHKAPRAVELQPHTTASAQGTSGGPIRDVGVRGIIRDNQMATQPPVHKAPRAVELQPHTPRVHMHLLRPHSGCGCAGDHQGQPDPQVELRSVHAWTDARIYQQFFNTGLCAAWRQYF
jgi:hypothetical protein